MGQREVLKFLEDRRIINSKWYALGEIQRGLKKRGLENGSIKNVSKNLFKLTMFGLIEWKGKGIWSHQKLFRGKKNI